MAYLIESHGYPSESMRNKAPYNLCEQVARTVYEEFPSDNKAILVALCDISLNSINPGLTFFNILSSMKLLEFLPNNADDVYKFIDKHIEDNVEEIYIDEIKTAMDRINFIYSKDIKNVEGITVANKWLKERLIKAKYWRDINRKFITNIMNYKDKEFESYFLKILDELGIPLIKDQYGDIFNGATVKDPNLDLTFVNIPITLFKLFDEREEDNMCDLRGLCEKNPGLVNDSCIDSPWENSANESLCPMGLIWYHRCLRGKSIVKN